MDEPDPTDERRGIVLGEGEPEAGPWRVAPLAELISLLLHRRPHDLSRPWIVAVDGRSAGGKTTLSGRVQAAVPGTVVIHTDDIAWWHSRFGWHDVMVDEVLIPLRQGRSVRFQPPGWGPRGRTGYVEAPGDAALVLIEGVGASRRELVPLLDAAVWVQSDFQEAERRGLARDGGDATTEREWHEWMAEEIPFLAADRPWERADVIVGGSQQLPHDQHTEVLLADRSSSVDQSRSAAHSGRSPNTRY